MIVAIHQPHYLPWLRYLHKMASCDIFVLLDDAQYTKNGWQNRNKIKGPHGPVMLTVPVRDAVFKPIHQVQINNEVPWREKHWKSLQFNYARAPFFRQYAEIFESTYAKRWDLLSPLNCHLIGGLAQAFGIRASLVLSSSLDVAGHGTERLVGICRRLGAAKYLTGAYAASSHFDEQMFVDSAVRVIVQAWEYPRYHQTFPALGFLPELSSVDLLFNEGPESARILRNGRALLQVVG